MKKKTQKQRIKYIPKTVQYLFEFTAGLLGFLGILFVLPWQNQFSNQPISFHLHGSAMDWDFLFEEKVDVELLINQETTTTSSTPHIPTSGITNNDKILVNSRDSGTPITIITGCMTPRGETIQNGDFVLAYKQRSDVNTICNVERRICNKGILEGSFQQENCDEDVAYSYQKDELVVYNPNIRNPYKQPSKLAPLRNEEFNMQGKIDDPLEKNTTRDNTIDISQQEPQETVQQDKITRYNCTTPRQEIVKHGQFIKAYEYNYGFIDKPCKVELRLCINGYLKGSNTFASCEPLPISYEDFLQNRDEEDLPSPDQLMDILENQISEDIKNQQKKSGSKLLKLWKKLWE